jgi:hypothetical protein
MFREYNLDRDLVYVVYVLDSAARRAAASIGRSPSPR